MNTAWSATLALWSPLHSLLRRLTLAPQPVPQPAGSPLLRPAGAVAASPVVRDVAAVARPLRVVRVLEAGQPRTQVGRMVISGRMADVCAELDRLAAREAA